MIGYCSFQMTTESNSYCLQILCQFFIQREAKPKLIAPFIIQLHFVECSNNSQDKYKYHTVFVLLRNTQVTNWIEVTKKFCLQNKFCFLPSCLDRNLKVKNLN